MKIIVNSLAIKHILNEHWKSMSLFWRFFLLENSPKLKPYLSFWFCSIIFYKRFMLQNIYVCRNTTYAFIKISKSYCTVKYCQYCPYFQCCRKKIHCVELERFLSLAKPYTRITWPDYSKDFPKTKTILIIY